MIPDNSGAPLARATPKHSGNATRKTTKPDDRLALYVFLNANVFILN
jgi:hypothetical protein